MKSSFISYWKSIAWALLILAVCLMPSSNLERVKFFNIPYMDKFVHLMLYFILSIFLISDSKQIKHFGSFIFKTTLTLVTIAFLYGLLIELFQYTLTTSRSASFWDVVANSIGISLALISYKWLNRITEGKI